MLGTSVSSVSEYTPVAVPPSMIFVTPNPPITGSPFTEVTENTNPLAVIEAPPSDVMFPFPVAVVKATSVAAFVVTEGATAAPPMKYLGIGNPLCSNHQQSGMGFHLNNQLCIFLNTFNI